MTLSLSRLNQWLSRVLHWGVGPGGGDIPRRSPDPYFTREDQKHIERALADPVPIVRVRIAVAVNSKGRWHSTGDSDRVSTDTFNAEAAVRNLGPGHNTMVHYVEADVPIPQSRTINANGDQQ